MSQRRHGLELRGGRWCSRQELDRLRREAADGGSEAIERLLRTEHRCGTPLENNLNLVSTYVLARVEESLPSAPVTVRDFGYGTEVRVGDVGINIIRQFQMQRGGQWFVFNPKVPRPGKPMRVQLEIWDEDPNAYPGPSYSDAPAKHVVFSRNPGSIRDLKLVVTYMLEDLRSRYHKRIQGL